MRSRYNSIIQYEELSHMNEYSSQGLMERYYYHLPALSFRFPPTRSIKINHFFDSLVDE